jgi:hypothetical protein
MDYIAANFPYCDLVYIVRSSTEAPTLVMDTRKPAFGSFVTGYIYYYLNGVNAVSNSYAADVIKIRDFQVLSL